jgi:hypothetical protein
VIEMAIRICLRIRTRYEPIKDASVVALVNSGFEADSPQILIPIKLANELGLYSRLMEARIESYGTVAGPVRMYVLPSSVEVWISEADVESPKVVCDTLISDTEVEVLISDYLAGELGIVAEDFRRGFWRLYSDPVDKRRCSYPPQRWVG